MQDQRAAAHVNTDVLDSATVAFCVTDRSMTVLRASRGWRRDRQLGDQNIIGRSLYELVPSTVAWKSRYERCLAGEELREDHIGLDLPDGTRRWVRPEITPWRDPTGAIGGLLILTIDVTDMVTALRDAARKQEQLKLALEIGGMQMWTIDHKRRKVEASNLPAAARTLDYEEFQEGIWETIHPEDRAGAREAWDRYLETGEPYRQTFRQILSDGSERWVQSACERIRHADGRVVSTVGAIRDIEKERAAEAAILRAKDAAEAASRAKSEFLANMSHEIRTPLNGVMGIAGALAKTKLDAPQAEMVALIENSAKTLEALLTDILDLARIEAGRMEIRPEPFDLATSVNACVSLFEASADAKGLRLETEIAPYAHGSFHGDAPRIRQILTNLIGNAVKFTSAGRVKVKVEATRCETSTRLVFAVMDTGIGFDETVRQRLFGRFQQADGSITREFGGSGLGLAISQSLATAMGGTLDGEGAPGEGATFTLTLDLPRSEGTTELWDDDNSSATAGCLTAMKVLVAEDHPTNRRMVELILGATGVQLVMVANGAEAVEQATLHRFDLIFMDMQMPVMDGLTAIRKIREGELSAGRPRVPIFTLTANAMPEHSAASADAGADGHVTKPITADRLLAVVEDVWLQRSAGVF